MISSFTVGEERSATSRDITLRNFVAAVPAINKGGECRIFHPPGSKVTLATAFFPSFTAATNRLTLTFDSVGNLVNFVDHRGRLPERVPADSTTTPAQRDKVFQAAMQNTRQTFIQLDFASDRATAMNVGGQGPNIGVGGTIAAVLNVASLGPPLKRIAHARKICDV